jgi:limonene 1,2-monooxygenase
VNAHVTLDVELARRLAGTRNYELFAEAVMPHFTGQLEPVRTTYDLIMSGGSTYVDATLNAQFASIAQYQEERAAKDEPAS